MSKSEEMFLLTENPFYNSGDYNRTHISNYEYNLSCIQNCDDDEFLNMMKKMWFEQKMIEHTLQSLRKI